MFDLERVKEHLRIEHDFDDDLILGYMAAAKDFAETFLGRKLEEFDELPATVLSGLLLHVGLMYEDREGQFHEKNLQAVRLLYYPHRRMAL
jgi:uncharacterized phage protein (predicted DNA packaging)